MRGEKAIKRMRAALKVAPEDNIRDAAWEELSGESHRAAIILATTLVEDKLETALRSKMGHLTKDHLSDLFDFNRPLGTFSAKIDVAHAFGLIHRRERDSCHIVREMRNAAAHARRPFSFATPEIRGVLEALTENKLQEKHTPDLARMIFVGQCSSLAYAVEHGVEKAVEMFNQALRETREEAAAQRAALPKRRPSGSSRKSPEKGRKGSKPRPPRPS